MHEAIQILIALAPALFLVASLIAGRFPGERSLERLASHRAAKVRAPRSIALPALHRGTLLTRRLHGGLLMATNRANRPPPPLLA